jgi:hypothetical protein
MAEPERPPSRTDRPHPDVAWSLVVASHLLASKIFLHHLSRLHLHRSLSWFDPRDHVGPSGLYKQTPAPLRHQVIGDQVIQSQKP